MLLDLTLKPDSGSRVQDLGLRLQGQLFRGQVQRCRIQGPEFRIQVLPSEKGGGGRGGEGGKGPEFTIWMRVQN